MGNNNESFNQLVSSYDGKLAELLLKEGFNLDATEGGGVIVPYDRVAMMKAFRDTRDFLKQLVIPLDIGHKAEPVLNAAAIKMYWVKVLSDGDGHVTWFVGNHRLRFRVTYCTSRGGHYLWRSTEDYMNSNMPYEFKDNFVECSLRMFNHLGLTRADGEAAQPLRQLAELKVILPHVDLSTMNVFATFDTEFVHGLQSVQEQLDFVHWQAQLIRAKLVAAKKKAPNDLGDDCTSFTHLRATCGLLDADQIGKCLGIAIVNAALMSLT